MRLGVVVVLAACLARFAAAEETVEWRDAAQCVGRFCAVRGRVAETRDDGPVIRLYFDAQRRDVYVTLVRGWLVTWPDYTGHEIVVTGRVDRFHDAVEIMVDDPSDISDSDAPTPPPPPPTAAATPAEPPAAPPTVAATPAEPPPAPPPAVATPAAPPPATPGEVERLRERVHELEDRVRELEQQPAR